MNRDELLTQMVMEVAPSDWHDAQLERRYRDDVFGWNEYQLRRAELVNKPSWDDAPEWAQWLAQDADGEWRAFKNFPKTGPDHWFSSERISKGKMSKGTIPAGHDWRQTLEARPAFDESRADAIGQNGNDGNHYRELNPTSSSLTHSQAVEAARDTGVCSDGLPCGQDIGQGPVYCAGCPNEPMTPEEEELPAQEKHDCPRCGGCFYSPPHEECPCQGKQERYRDQDGDDWIDEFARTSTIEQFRGAMRFTIGKYNRRMGKKDEVVKEIRKMRDYCDRWLAYEVDQ